MMSRDERERWRRIEAICDAALDLTDDAREAYLANACGDDADLRRGVDTLLAHDRTAQDFLGTPVEALAANVMTLPPRDLIGRRLGDYEITERLGEGGMGEVYRARDRKLGRDVAIKVLPPAFADDPERLKRFEREAKLLATVNHPGIGAIYGLIEHDGIRALVLELIDGDTLAAALVRGPLPLARALSIAAQIADALDHAHRRSITHRDLKPSNVMLTKGGVKLLDFGVGKWTPAAPGAIVTGASTLTAKGTIVGTLHYMAPEQLEGRETDARSDIFAFGAVLYEMLTGRKAFDGPSQASIIAAVMEAHAPRLTGVGGALASRLERVVNKCLAKNADERWQSTADLRDELRWLSEDLLGDRSSPETTALPSSPRSSRLLRVAAGGAAAVLAVTAAYAGWQAARTAEPTGTGVVRRFVLTPPPNARMQRPTVALSPDGTRVVYTGRQLLSRRFDSFDAEPIAGTENAYRPFFSFDGQSIGFSNGRRILRVPVSGGTARVVADTPGTGTHGAFWTSDGQILFSKISVPISRVPADGGSPTVVVPIDEANNEIDQHDVVQLPSGVLLYGSHTGSNVFHVAALSPDGKRRILIRNAFTPRYLPTGQLVFARGQSLRVVDFDPERLTIGGTERTVIEDVLTVPESGAAFYSVSNNGTLAYVPAPSRRGRTLMWVDRSGRAEPVRAPPREYLFPSLSPDGTTLAVQVTEEDGNHIWLHRILDGSSNRLVLQGSSSRPQWTPDGRAIVVASERGEERLLVRQSVDAGTPEQILARSNKATFWPGWWTLDGATLLFIENPPTDESRIRRLQLTSSASETLPLGSGTQRAPALSPDGRWLAYASDQSGRTEVYVRAVSGDGVARQITTQGGGEPRWSRDGREIFFSSGRGGTQIAAVSVTFAPGLQIGPPRLLFTVPFATPGATGALGPPPWDVTADGRRFVMVKSSDEELQPSVIAIVEGWFEELKRGRDQQKR
jgi:hypothetical protein